MTAIDFDRLTERDIAKTIDHSLLRPELDDAFVERRLSPHVVFTATDTDVTTTPEQLKKEIDEFLTELVEQWEGFDAQSALSEALGVPTIVLNDAEVHGAGVIAGQGLELVLTLGTGLGCAIFDGSRLAPHLEMSQAPVRWGGELKAAGAEALAVFPPFPTFLGNPVPTEMIYAYHKAIADGVNLPFADNSILPRAGGARAAERPPLYVV